MKLRLLVATFFASVCAFGQNPGDMDLNFGTAGFFQFVLDDTPSSMVGIRTSDMYTLPDGKILAVGTSGWGCSASSYYAGVIMRLNPDGTFDTTFNGTGFISYDSTEFYKIIPTSDGKYLIPGQFNTRKIDADGNLDLTFGGGDGIINVVGGNMIIDPNGKLITATSGNVRRYFADGTIDTTFGVNGMAGFPVGPGTSKGYSYIQVGTDGKIILFGNSSTTSQKWLIAARYNSDGTLDNTFASDGQYERQTFDTCYTKGFVINPDNTILLMGYGGLGSTTRIFFIKLNPDGTGIPSFGNNGAKTVGLTTFAPGVGEVHRLQYGKLAMTGRLYPKSFFLAIFDSEGNLTTDIAPNGFASYPVPDDVYMGANGSTMVGDQVVIAGSYLIWDCARSKYKTAMVKLKVGETLETNDFQRSNIGISPNPVTDLFSIQIPGIETIKTISLTDTSGRTIAVVNPILIQDNNATVDVQHLPKGLYFVTIVTNGNKKMVGKILKR